MLRVALLYDVEGWAWAHMARDLSEFSPEGVDVRYALASHIGTEWKGKWDCIFDFSWASCPLQVNARRHSALVTSSGILYEAKDPADWNTRIVTKSRNARRARERLPHFDAVLASNPALAKAAELINVNTYHTPIGVNDRIFKPSFRRPRDGPFVIGWCANRSGDSVKGHDEVLVPLMQHLGNHVYEWRVNTYNHRNAMSREEMAEWYRGLDVFICTSINEGSPNTVFEAAACGVPVVSTDVGMVSGWKELRDCGMVVPRYKDADSAKLCMLSFARRLKKLRRSPGLWVTVSQSLLWSVQDVYSWRHLAPQWWRAILGGDL